MTVNILQHSFSVVRLQLGSRSFPYRWHISESHINYGSSLLPPTGTQAEKLRDLNTILAARVSHHHAHNLTSDAYRTRQNYISNLPYSCPDARFLVAHYHTRSSFNPFVIPEATTHSKTLFLTTSFVPFPRWIYAFYIRRMR